MRTINVQGKGIVKAEPDIAILQFQAIAKSHDYSDCIRDMNAQVEALRIDIETAGIDRAELKTTDFRININTRFLNDGRRVFDGYTASHKLNIEIPFDKGLLNKVLRIVAKAHSGVDLNISFSVKNKEALRHSVLAEAVRVAKSNAELLADAAGIKLGKLMQINYGWTEVRFYEDTMTMSGADLCSGPEYDADEQPAELEAEDTVTLMYEIND